MKFQNCARRPRSCLVLSKLNFNIVSHTIFAKERNLLTKLQISIFEQLCHDFVPCRYEIRERVLKSDIFQGVSPTYVFH